MHDKENFKHLATILICAYNYGNYILETLKSIDQYINNDQYQVIVINDCSSDNTEEIIKSSYPSGIEYYRNGKNLGKSNSTKKGYKKAAGKYFFVLDADDLYLPKKIEKCIEIFESHPDVSIVNHNYYLIDSNGKHISNKDYALNQGKHSEKYYIRRFLSGTLNEPIGFGSIFNTRTALLKPYIDQIDESFNQSIDSYLQLAAISNGKIYHLNEYLSQYRVHPNSLYQSKSPHERMKLLLDALHNVSLIDRIKENELYFNILQNRIHLLETIFYSRNIFQFILSFFKFLLISKTLSLGYVFNFIYRKIGRI